MIQVVYCIRCPSSKCGSGEVGASAMRAKLVMRRKPLDETFVGADIQ
jgi:hypothetical protein